MTYNIPWPWPWQPNILQTSNNTASISAIYIYLGVCYNTSTTILPKILLLLFFYIQITSFFVFFFWWKIYIKIALHLTSTLLNEAHKVVFLCFCENVKKSEYLSDCIYGYVLSLHIQLLLIHRNSQDYSTKYFPLKIKLYIT